MASIDSLFEPEDLRSLTDIGFMAMSHGLTKPAAAIFEAVSALRPRSEAGWVGRAMILLHEADVDRAIVLLRKAPPTDAVRVTLGLALQRRGELAEARSVLADVVATARETGPRQLAHDTLAAMDLAPRRN